MTYTLAAPSTLRRQACVITRSTNWLTSVNVVTFNSETQLLRFGPRVHKHASIGLRVNTGVSNVEDSRYDPARPYSQTRYSFE